jgi:hypothetical protein
MNLRMDKISEEDKKLDGNEINNFFDGIGIHYNREIIIIVWMAN